METVRKYCLKRNLNQGHRFDMVCVFMLMPPLTVLTRLLQKLEIYAGILCIYIGFSFNYTTVQRIFDKPCGGSLLVTG